MERAVLLGDRGELGKKAGEGRAQSGSGGAGGLGKEAETIRKEGRRAAKSPFSKNVTGGSIPLDDDCGRN